MQTHQVAIPAERSRSDGAKNSVRPKRENRSKLRLPKSAVGPVVQELLLAPL